MQTITTLIRRKALWLFGVVFILLAIVPSWYFYSKYQSAQYKLQHPQAAKQQTIDDALAKIGKLMVLPTDEQPTVATVTDWEKVKEQPFFANAQNGDTVLIYSKARKAILYRESINKIIDIGPVSFTDQTATPSASQSASFSTALYNGTGVVGLTKRCETMLRTKAPALKVVSKENAATTTYAKSVIVDVNGNKPSDIIKLSQTLGLEVASLPAGEATPAADFLIILGSDTK